MDDYDAPVKKRKYTKRKKEEEVECTLTLTSDKKDPEQEIVRYVEDLEREAIRQQKVLEVSRAKHRLLISRYATLDVASHACSTSKVSTARQSQRVHYHLRSRRFAGEAPREGPPMTPPPGSLMLSRTASFGECRSVFQHPPV